MRSLSFLLTSSAAFVGLLLFSTNSLSTEQKTYSGAIGSYAMYVTIPGAKAVGPEQCVACHKEIANNFRHAYHSQAGVDCEECHGNGSLHVDGGGDISKIVSYSRRTAREANGACLSCHGQDEKIRNAIASKHSANGVRCMECHQIHGKTSGPETTARSFDTASVGLVKASGDLVPESRVFMEPRWFHQKLGFSARYTYNSARSGMNPDLNPNNAAQLGNAGLIAQGVFDPVLFGEPCPPGQVCSALAALQLASTQISQVIVPQNIGEAKIYYLFPRKFNAGLLFYYGSYRDVWNPNLNGVLRTYSFYVGRNW
jgi:hypothetical protein